MKNKILVKIRDGIVWGLMGVLIIIYFLTLAPCLVIVGWLSSDESFIDLVKMFYFGEF